MFNGHCITIRLLKSETDWASFAFKMQSLHGNRCKRCAALCADPKDLSAERLRNFANVVKAVGQTLCLASFKRALEHNLRLPEDGGRTQCSSVGSFARRNRTSHHAPPIVPAVLQSCSPAVGHSVSQSINQSGKPLVLQFRNRSVITTIDRNSAEFRYSPSDAGRPTECRP